MREGVLLLAAILAAYSGCALLALSQTAHWKAIAGGNVPPSAKLQRAGVGLLALCFVLALLRDGVVFGIVLCFFLCAAAGIAVAFTLALRPGWLRRFVKR